MQESTNRHRENFKIYDTIPNYMQTQLKIFMEWTMF